jgi:uncharacterized protein (TIGR04255 family)
MQSDWPVLKSPPVILAIFQLKFTHADSGELSRMIENDRNIRKMFPLRKDNFHSNIGVQGTPAPGISMLKAKADTKITAYAYFTPDQKRKLIIEQESVTFANEDLYYGWDSFKKDVMDCLELLAGQLDDCIVKRTSIRFVNKFSLDSFADPLDYFSKTISTDSEANYPLVKYAFRLNVQVPKTDIAAIINHALEPNSVNNLDYYFDIDVLDHRQVKFDLSLTSKQMEQIRAVKNNIFFDTVKQKTIDLCN